MADQGGNGREGGQGHSWWRRKVLNDKPKGYHLGRLASHLQESSGQSSLSFGMGNIPSRPPRWDQLRGLVLHETSSGQESGTTTGNSPFVAQARENLSHNDLVARHDTASRNYEAWDAYYEQWRLYKRDRGRIGSEAQGEMNQARAQRDAWVQDLGGLEQQIDSLAPPQYQPN